jgi:hypothetical protein
MQPGSQMATQLSTVVVQTPTPRRLLVSLKTVQTVAPPTTLVIRPPSMLVKESKSSARKLHLEAAASQVNNAPAGSVNSVRNCAETSAGDATKKTPAVATSEVRRSFMACTGKEKSGRDLDDGVMYTSSSCERPERFIKLCATSHVGRPGRLDSDRPWIVSPMRLAVRRSQFSF